MPQQHRMLFIVHTEEPYETVVESVCRLSVRVRSRKLSEIGAKFRRLSS